MKIIRNFLQKKRLKQLFLTLIKPYIDYVTIPWKSAPKSHLTKIDGNTRKTMRLMIFKEKRYTATPLYEFYKTLLANLNNKLLQAEFMKKCVLQKHT